MPLSIVEKKTELSAKTLDAAAHALLLLPEGKTLPAVPGRERLAAALKRKNLKAGELSKTPLALETGTGLHVYAMLDPNAEAFVRHERLRRALAPLLDEHPAEIQLALFGDESFKRLAAGEAVYCAAVNAQPLPTQKSGKTPAALQRLTVHGVVAEDGYAPRLAVAEGNLLARSLTNLPPNQLTPGAYRKRIAALAREYGWKLEEFGFDKLKKMGAGAFCAVAQGSPAKDAAIMHVRYQGSGIRNRKKPKTVALVGKGICFDTGGHNLKPARYMHGMHEDMNGSAVVLGILAAASRLQLPLQIDGWLALAENHISPAAYRQNEIVRALNGTTIEVVHTDAEGRMVLADTLTLAARGKPDLIADFATLTGSMHYALGSRMSGVFATSSELAHAASRAGSASGERVVVFPQPEDYDASLDSAVADIKQCTLEGEADHILATRFLSRFTAGIPWLHMDLSASTCKGGLGAVMSDLTGFGVGWGVELLAGGFARIGAR